MRIELPVRQRGESCDPPGLPPAEWSERTAGLLRALGDPTRLAMVVCLCRADGPVCVCDFTAAFELGQPTISHHMGKLRAAGLVESEKRGIWTYYRLRQDLPAATRDLVGALVAEAGGRTLPT